MNVAYINPKIITWALARLKKNPEEIATNTMPAEKIRAWERGEHYPTEPQAEVLATKLRIPYLVLFLSTPPPAEAVPIPDLRTRSGRSVTKPSADFIEVINGALIRQDWFREQRKSSGASKLNFVGRFGINDSVPEVAASMRSVLRVNNDFRSACRSWEDFLRRFIQQAESVGILVMKSGVVGHANQRRLNVKEFQGFALSDPLAPVVFINDCDAQAAQIFTLAHELAHIWIGETGISNARLVNRSLTDLAVIERFCNQVAAEFLVPEKSLKVSWQSRLEPRQNIERIIRFFRVSSLVALRRAYDLKHLEYGVFKRLMQDEYAKLKAIEEKNRKKQAERQKRLAGDFWATFRLRSSTLLAKTVAAKLRNASLTYSEASSLLGVSISTVERFLQRESAA